MDYSRPHFIIRTVRSFDADGFLFRRGAPIVFATRKEAEAVAREHLVSLGAVRIMYRRGTDCPRVVAEFTPAVGA